MADGTKPRDHAQTEDDLEEGVSLRPSDWVRDDGEEVVMLVRAFRLKGQKDDRLTVPLPLDMRRAAEILSNEVRRPISHVLLWAIERGLERLQSLPEVQDIADGRRALLDAGSDDIGQLDPWGFHIAARDGSKRITVRFINSSDIKCASRHSESLGLSQATVATLAVLFGVVDAPLPGSLPRVLSTEVSAFLQALRRRATIARDLGQRAARSPRTRLRVSWAALLDEEQ